MPDYISSLHKILSDVENNERIEVEFKNFKLSTKNATTIIDDSAKIGYSLANTIVDFYQQIEAFELSWVVKDHNGLIRFKGDDATIPIRGNIRIDNYLELLEESRWDNIIWFTDDDPEVLATEKQLRPFDYFNPDLSGAACLFVNKDNTVMDDLKFFSHEGGYYFEEAKECWDSGLTIANYIELLTKTRGYGIWQRIYEDQQNGSTDREMQQYYTHYMQQLFEDFKF